MTSTMMLAQEAAGNDQYLLWGFGLMAIAVFFLVLELFVPSGGLLGGISAVCVIGSDIAFFMYDTTWGFAFLFLYLLAGPILVVFGFKLWINSPLGRRIVLGGDVSDDPEESMASEVARREELQQIRQLIGAEGVTVTALRPVGVVKIEGRRIDALAETGIIEADTPVIVTDAYDNQLKVRPAE